jgi:release factor glutamine methyltransferase
MDIYEPAEDSYLLQRFVREYAFGRVLDVGTGSGIQALTATQNKNVREVIAVDINEDVIDKIKESKEVQLSGRIKAKVSDLFSNVKNQFDVIIFNPPYLPQDKIGKEIIEDPALYGGKQGWEVSERFFSEVTNYLSSNGKILFLFSSLTNKEKIEEIISKNLLDFKQLAEEKMPMFETLYVYLVEKSDLLRELERKGIEEIKYLTHGKRGNIFTGIIDKSKLVKKYFPSKKNIVKVAIKVKREESKAIGRMEIESNWLKIINKSGIGPRYMFSGDDYLVYQYAEGEFILDWAKDKSVDEIKKVLLEVLEQCYVMDSLGVNKEEMHHPLKHIIVGKTITLLDFERCSRTDKPKNVTQVVEFICRMDLGLDKDQLRDLAQDYKNDFSREKFDLIKKTLVGLSNKK